MRTLIKSSDPAFRIALEIALREEPGFSVVAAVSTIDAVPGVLAATPCDLAILDDDDDLDPAVAQLHARHPGLQLIVRTRHPRPPTPGVDNVVAADAGPVPLIDTIRQLRKRRRADG